MNLINKTFKFFSILFIFLFITEKNLYSEFIVNLIGDWEGLNKSYSLEKGYRTWEKKFYFKFMFNIMYLYHKKYFLTS